MHRPLVIAALGLLLAAVPLSAQHGGGHASGGGHGGFSSGGSGFSSHSGFSGASRAFSGARSGSGYAARPLARGFSSRAFSSRGYYNHNGVGVRIRSYGYGANGYRNCYGCGWGYGYPYFGVDPYWWGDTGSSYDPDKQYQTGLANEMNEQSLEQQRQQGDQDLYAQWAPAPPRQHQAERTVASPATLLVFRDRHQQEVENYAIVGETVWVFDPQQTQKVPLSDLDLPATTKANGERGVGFHLPGAPEGQ
jgi:hypothetical protein